MSETEYSKGMEDEYGDWKGKVEWRKPRAAASAVFSVRFARDEIAAIRRAADNAGERTSEFIRIAALTRARGGRFIALDLVPSTGAPPAAFGTRAESTHAVSDYNFARVA